MGRPKGFGRRWLGAMASAILAAVLVTAPGACVAGTVVASGAEAETEPGDARLYGAGSGRFAVIAGIGEEGAALAELADEAWSRWREPLGLPARLPSSITVRLVPASLWGFGDRGSHVVAEPGGVVSVSIRGGDDGGVARERRWLLALAEGVLRRKASLIGALPERALAPAWLQAAAAEAVITARRSSMLDAWQAAMRTTVAPARLRDVLFLERIGPGKETKDEALAAFGVWLWLREEGTRSGAWTNFVAALVAGEAAGSALAREYARLTPRAAEAREWELAWRVASAGLANARVTPVMEPAESRRRLEALSRIVAVDRQSGGERIVQPWGEWGARDAGWLREELSARARLLVADFSRLHPFYRNAAGSLGRAWSALANGREREWREAGLEWVRDMQAGRSLESASTRLLDEWEVEQAAGSP